MADYRELLRRAVAVLPENNGAARRDVYEKARAALVSQLRAINPPLPAREITQHQLQLEDCIRQVEQEATEMLLGGLKRFDDEPARPVRQAPPPARARQEPAFVQLPALEEEDEDLPAEEDDFEVAADEPDPAEDVFEEAYQAEAEDEPEYEPDPEPEPEPEPMPPPRAARDRAPPQRSTTPQRAATAQKSAAAEKSTPARKSTIEDIIAKAQAATGSSRGSKTAVVAPPPPAAPASRGNARHVTPRSAGAAATAVQARQNSSPANGPAARENPPGARVADPKPMSNGHAGPARPAPRAEPAQRPATEGTPVRTNGKAPTPARRAPPRPAPEPEAEYDLEQDDISVADDLGNAYGQAASSVRDVAVEPARGRNADPQAAIDRAIAALDREARGETSYEEEFEIEPVTRPAVASTRGATARRRPEPAFDRFVGSDSRFASSEIEDERGGINALTIFLAVFLVLLLAAGGAGFWAWREGYVDLGGMFGQSSTTQTSERAAGTPSSQQSASNSAPVNTSAGTPAAAPIQVEPQGGSASDNTAGSTPRNVTPPADAGKDAERLTPNTADNQTPAAAANANDQKSEERLSTSAPTTTEQASPAAASASSGQSLLLEAQAAGTTGAVPFSGTVDWSRGTDERGQPTLQAKAAIPARNLVVELTIRKNADASLPASHLMEINFKVNESFVGGSIASLPGVLLKNEELVQGTPLVGASARVVGNSFLFALSASPEDVKTNIDLLTSRKWIDLALIYGTGRRAIITLEKNDAATALFNDVFKAWGEGTQAQ